MTEAAALERPALAATTMRLASHEHAVGVPQGPRCDDNRMLGTRVSGPEAPE